MSVVSVHSEESQQSEVSLLSCDLVFKGGITSGIVYPPAILQLKKRYTFCNIGGTSAGAIAAAGVAAAEFNRKNGGSNAGFTYLHDHVQQWLSEDRNLHNLFKASKATKPLMDSVLALLPTSSATATKSAAQTKPVSQDKSRKSKKPITLQSLFRLLGVWLFNYLPISLSAVFGAIVGIILLASLPLAVFAVVYLVSPTSAAQGVRSFTIVAVILGILGAWFGWHVGGVISAILKLPDNFYGICTGYSTKRDGTPDITNLTGWLNKVLDEMAGNAHTAPLTFEDLKGKEITLKMITSNLSHGLPYTMPEGLHNFIFKKSDMLKLFPRYVVQHMIDNQPNEPLIPRDKLPQLGGDDGYYYLPNEEKLPVIVCTRMSLSFPILLSAVPLYTISTQAYNDFRDGKILKHEHLQLNWFSDGGICSNFPIQFFDAWLPKRPTFGFNLTKLSSANATSALQEYNQAVQSAAATARKKSDEPVYLPKAEDRQDIEWDNVNGLAGFARAIFGTAQNCRDTLQANLPSYRERIVQIRLNKDEGGLNLAMPKAIIEKVVNKGSEAGAIFCDRKGFDLEQHIWVRFLVLMDQLEHNIMGLQEVLKAPDFELKKELIGGQTGESIARQIALLEQQLEMSSDSQLRYPYWRDKQWTENATQRVTALLDLIYNGTSLLRMTRTNLASSARGHPYPSQYCA